MNNTLTLRKNKHLSEVERYQIEILLKDGLTITQIADRLSRNKSSIYREIKSGTVELRNSDWSIRKEYSAYHSIIVHQHAMSKTGKKKKLTTLMPDLLNYIQNKLNAKYSPDAISGELKREGIYCICTQTIYNYINLGIFKYKEYKKRKKVKYKSLQKIAYNNTRGRSISERPFQPDERPFGNWEMDTVVGKRGTKDTLLVLTERLSRYEIIIKLKDKTQKSVISALDNLETKYKDIFSLIFKSITVDNGVEFLDMESLEKSVYNKLSKRTTIYYSHAYCSWERGSNENNNKLIRKFIKKKKNIKYFSGKDIYKIQDWINNYPRKLFNYKTANDIFFENLHNCLICRNRF